MITAERANEIQAEWMALESGASKDEQQRVFALMKELPKDYYSLSADGKNAVALFGGSPANVAMPLAECRKHWKITSPIAWQCDKWVDLV